MALPRYKPSEVRNIGAGASAIAYQAQSAAYQNLSSKMDQWRGVFQADAEKQTAIQAEEQAYKDSIDGKPFHKENVHTVYGQAYNNTRKATYVAQAEIDINNKSNELAEQFKDDPEGYRNSFQAYLDATKDETKMPDIEMAIGVSGAKKLDAQYKKLNDNKIEDERKTQRVVFAEYAEQKQSELVNAMMQGDTRSVELIKQSLDEYTTSMIEEGNMSEAEFIEYYNKFEYGVNRSFLEQSMHSLVDTNNFEEAQKVYDDFTKEIPKGYTIDQYKKTKSSLGTILNGAKKQRKAELTQLKNEANMKVQDTIDILNSGKTPKYELTAEEMALASESKIQKYNIALEANDLISEISELPLSQQEQELNKMKADPKASKVETEVLKQMETNLKETRRMWDKDPISQGIVKLNHEDFTIDFYDFSSSDDLRARDIQAKGNVDEAGATAWKLLKESEAKNLAELLKNPQTPIQDIEIILGNVMDAGTDIADSVFRQLDEKKAYTFSYAGRLSNYGNGEAAQIALQGKGADVKLEEGTKQDIQSQLQGVFRFSPSSEYNTMLKGTIDYIKGKMVSDPTYEIDIKEALEETIGKVENYNGANVVMPYGVDQAKFETWLDDFETDDLPQEVVEDINDMTDWLGSGEAQLHRVDNGKYYIYYENGGNGFYQVNQDGKPYVLEYK